MGEFVPSIRVWLACWIALMGSLAVGMAIGWSSNANLEMLGKAEFKDEIQIQETENWKLSLIALTFPCGALLGALIVIPVASTLGRKWSMILVAGPFAGAFVTIYLAASFEVLIFGRILEGIATGFVCGTVPVYIIELSTPRIRGLIGASFQIFIVIGILLCQLLSFVVSNRIVAMISAVPCAIMGVGMIFMPRSPVWLVSKKGKDAEDCKKNLMAIRKSNSDIQGELYEIDIQAQNKPKLCLGLSDLSRREIYLPFFLALALQFFQQFSGINVIIFFQGEIFKKLHKEGSNLPKIEATVGLTVQFVATVIGGFFIERFGRKKMLIGSGLGHMVALAIIGIFAVVQETNEAASNSVLFLPIVAIVIYFIAFSVGYGPIPWMMISEMTAYEARSFVSAIATSANWSFATFVTGTFHPIKDLIKVYSVFFIYSVLSGVSVLFTHFFLPETKGKTLNDIQQEFKEEVKMRKSKEGVNEPKNTDLPIPTVAAAVPVRGAGGVSQLNKVGSKSAVKSP